MNLYIDPGTGSMLFAILIGIIGAVRYAIKIGLVKLRFILTGGKKVESNVTIPYVIFSDNRRYWNIFEPICREFDKRGIDIVYLTASKDDPAFECGYQHVKAEFAGENNKAFAKLNFLDADILLSTTPGLDVYQWKRSRSVKYYVHMLHASSDVSMYRMFGIDYYDALLLSGDFQVRDVRKLEEIRNLPEKEICIIGIPYMDEMVTRLEEYNKSKSIVSEERVVLLAPSWGPSSILNLYGGKFIEKLLETGYHIIIRPHPQSFDSEKELMDKLMKKYPESSQLEWNRDVDNFDVLNRADIMISDFSGVIFDFALVYDKPIIYSVGEFDKAPYDAWWLEDEVWTLDVLPKIGKSLDKNQIDSIKDVIDECIDSTEYAQGREQARNETWQYRGEGTQRAVQWLIDKHTELITNNKGDK